MSASSQLDRVPAEHAAAVAVDAVPHQLADEPADLLEAARAVKLHHADGVLVAALLADVLAVAFDEVRLAAARCRGAGRPPSGPSASRSSSAAGRGRGRACRRSRSRSGRSCRSRRRRRRSRRRRACGRRGRARRTTLIHGYFAAYSARIAGVSSFEPSSTMTQSAGRTVWFDHAVERPPGVLRLVAAGGDQHVAARVRGIDAGGGVGRRRSGVRDRHGWRGVHRRLVRTTRDPSGRRVRRTRPA